MEVNENDFTESGKYTYAAKDVVFSTWRKMVIWWAGYWDRNAAFRIFCQDVNINLEDISAAKKRNLPKVAFPKSYLVKHKMIELAGDDRDKMVMALYVSYEKKKTDLEREIIRLSTSLEAIRKNSKKEEKHLADLQAELTRVSDNDDKIGIEGEIGNTKTRLKNYEFQLANAEDTLKDANKRVTANKEAWRHQVKICDIELKKVLGRFCNNYERKVIRKLQYDKFEFSMPDYAETVKRVVEG